MEKAKQRRLEQAGWKVGSTADFLGLSSEESAFVEVKIALANGLRRRREKQRLTQQQVADILGSSQSRVAKMEAAEASVSVDLLVQSLLRLGMTRSAVGKLIAADRPSAATGRRATLTRNFSVSK